MVDTALLVRNHIGPSNCPGYREKQAQGISYNYNYRYHGVKQYERFTNKSASRLLLTKISVSRLVRVTIIHRHSIHRMEVATAQ